jgi:murein DD-endopeptidase MepM/ murein hydrolase activator NlpD
MVVPPEQHAISQQLNALSQSIPQQKAELQQLLRQIDRYQWLVEHFPSQWPLHGRITSPFGYRFHPLRFRRIFHEGIDIGVQTGSSVKAAAGGKVIFAGNRSGYGKTVLIDHGQGLRTLYAHNSKLQVKAGQWVEKGEVISLSGNTGDSTGPHLHFEVQVNGHPKNPLDYLS